MNLSELLDSFPETDDDALTTLYGDIRNGVGELSSNFESASAKIAEQSAVIDTLNAEISKLKAHNYDLLMVTGDSKPDIDEPDSGESDSDSDTDITVDDLFKNDEEDK